MLTFLSPEIQMEFHKLPLERQRDVIQAAEGASFEILFVDLETLEVAVRINTGSETDGIIRRIID